MPILVDNVVTDGHSLSNSCPVVDNVREGDEGPVLRMLATVGVPFLCVVEDLVFIGHCQILQEQPGHLRPSSQSVVADFDDGLGGLR